MNGPERTDPFLSLDNLALQDWAGAKTLSRGVQYQREGRVRSLSSGPGRILVAWVDGAEEYATAVMFEEGITSECTCPVGNDCKHSVAVILEYQALISKNKSIPAIEAGDPRCVLLAIGPVTDPVQDPPGTIPLATGRAGKTNSRTAEPSSGTRQYLERMKKEELILLIEDLIAEYPEVQKEISDRRSVAAADAGPVQKALLADIKAISKEEVWSDSWSGKSQIPDYSPVRKRMDILLSMGRPDMVVEAGGILFKRGIAQIEQSDDYGEIAGEIASCMDRVFAALQRSSRPDHERMLFAIHALLDDEFDLCGKADTFLKGPWPGRTVGACRGPVTHRDG